MIYDGQEVEQPLALNVIQNEFVIIISGSYGSSYEFCKICGTNVSSSVRILLRNVNLNIKQMKAI